MSRSKRPALNRAHEQCVEPETIVDAYTTDKCTSDAPIPPDQQDPRHQELDAKRREYAHEIIRLADLFGEAEIIEDGVYRFYHQSFKVSHLLVMANEVFALLEKLGPDGGRLNPWFVKIAEDAERAWTGVPDMQTRNAHWAKYARPAVEFAFHCDYFLRQLVQYESAQFASMRLLPSGVAALLELYGVRVAGPRRGRSEQQESATDA